MHEDKSKENVLHDAVELAKSFENGGERLNDEEIGLSKPSIKFNTRSL
jgi:hypothetical protein